MRVLVSDKQSFEREQVPVGARSDFHWTDEGELLTFSVGGPCCNAASCGCNRSFTGIDSTKGSTIGFLAERDEADVRSASTAARSSTGTSRSPPTIPSS